jgi:hypothetical protein
MKYLIAAYCIAVSCITVKAQGAGFLKASVSFDYNSAVFDKGAFGPKIQVYSPNMYFGKNKQKKSRSGENMFTYACGMGYGSYVIRSRNKNNNDLYLLHAVLLVVYENRSYFEPFCGVFPGLAWGVEKAGFINPTAGVNVKAFHINRNWNSKLLQTYGQLHVEYNTHLSSVFFGVGFVLHFF